MEAKPGVKTTELWAVLLVILGVLAPLAWAALDKHPWLAGAIATAISLVAVAYAGLRTWLKLEVAGQTDLISAEFEGKLAHVLDRVNEAMKAIGKPLTVLLLCFALCGVAGGCNSDLIAREAARADRGLENAVANRETLIDALQKAQALNNETAGKLLAAAVKAKPEMTGELIEKEIAARLAQRDAVADFRTKDGLNVQEVRNCHARMVRASKLFGSKEEVSARLDAIENLILKLSERK